MLQYGSGQRRHVFRVVLVVSIGIDDDSNTLCLCSLVLLIFRTAAGFPGAMEVWGMEPKFDLEKFLVDVFAPVSGERCVVMVDLPTAACPDTDPWRQRRLMAAEWRAGLEALGRKVGFEVLPLAGYPATGSNNADLPAEAEVGGRKVPMASLFDEVSLVLAMTQFSPTAPLCGVCNRRPGADVFRAASMPGIEKRMEQTSLAADYTEVSRRCRILKDLFQGVDRAEVEFSTGHRCLFDLRFRVCEADDGYLHRDKSDDVPVINLPSGETFQVPYEGEKPGVPSRTAGELPVGEGGETIVFRVEANRIVEVDGGPGRRRRGTGRSSGRTRSAATSRSWPSAATSAPSSPATSWRTRRRGSTGPSAGATTSAASWGWPTSRSRRTWSTRTSSTPGAIPSPSGAPISSAATGSARR